MAIPTSYTEATLAAYMHEVLGADAVAKDLDWQPGEGDYAEAVVETALAYGVDDVATITGRENVRRLRAIARRELWRLVMQRTAHRRDTNTETGNDAHSQVYSHAREQFKLADEAVAEAYTTAVLPPPPPAGGALPNKYVPWGST